MFHCVRLSSYNSPWIRDTEMIFVTTPLISFHFQNLLLCNVILELFDTRIPDSVKHLFGQMCEAFIYICIRFSYLCHKHILRLTWDNAQESILYMTWLPGEDEARKSQWIEGGKCFVKMVWSVINNNDSQHWCFPCARPWSKPFCALTHLIPPTTLRDRYTLYLHFKDQEMGAQGDLVTSSRSHS